MRIVVARCRARYTGRLTAELSTATRLLMVKADGSVLLHSDGRSFKPLNWMSPPCTLRESAPDAEAAERGVALVWDVQAAKTDDHLRIEIDEVFADVTHEFGPEPGLVKDGVEAHLQELLAAQVEIIGPGVTLVRREFPTAIGPVDLLVRDPAGGTIAVEVKRRGDIDGVEQLTRYVDLLNRDPLLRPVSGVFAAQEIKPQARTLATDRGLRCVLLDYDAMRGIDDSDSRLF